MVTDTALLDALQQLARDRYAGTFDPEGEEDLDGPYFEFDHRGELQVYDTLTEARLKASHDIREALMFRLEIERGNGDAKSNRGS